MRLHSSVVKGQSLVVIALCTLALFSLVALAIDGGSALLQRRTMQNAADGGALAGIELLERNVVVSCSPLPCHPLYLLDNQTVATRITQLISANYGGVIGTAQYTVLIEYHFLAGAPSASDSYQAASNYPAGDLIPAFVDGVRVTAGVANPTIFAQAINIQTIPVSAVAAARLYGTCPPDDIDGIPLAVTRFRPTLEDSLRNNPANDPCNLFELWNGQADWQQNNLVSFNVYSFKASGYVQPLAGFDMRNGASGGVPLYGGSGNCPPACADMRGSTQATVVSATQDLQNWVANSWQGAFSLTSLYPAGSGTWSPANRTTSGGGRGAPTRPGDWIENYPADTRNVNIAGPLYTGAVQGTMIPYLSPPASQGGLNWGPASDRTIYLWGPAALVPGTGSSEYAQEWQNGVAIPNCPGSNCTYTGWEDLALGNSGSATTPNYTVASNWHPGAVTLDRVRVSRAIKVRFFANLQGAGRGAQALSGCSLPALSSNRAWGLILTTDVSGPVGTAPCGWQVGGAVYSRLIDP